MNKKRFFLLILVVLLFSAMSSAALASSHAAKSEATLVDAARQATKNFKNIDAAESAGYGLFHGCVSGPQEGAMGIHFVKGDLVGDGAIDASYYRLSRAYPDPDDPDFKPLGMDGLFTVTNLPSYRLLIDMSDLDRARIVITTGQSGHPFDRHYTDQIEPWRTGSTLPLPFTPAAIDAATVTTLALQPPH